MNNAGLLQLTRWMSWVKPLAHTKEIEGANGILIRKDEDNQFQISRLRRVENIKFNLR
jgi:hypothetical protein